MLKVAILDDYQNISQEFIDLKKLSGKYEIKVFSDPFENENLAKSNPNKVKEMESVLQNMTKIPEPPTNEAELTKEEEEKIESQLKKLGYIEKTDSISNNTQ